MENSAYLALPLFAGLAAGDIPAALAALDALCRPFAKGETLLEAGQRGAPMGVVLAGRVLIEHLDLWGNRTLLGRAAEGELAPVSCLTEDGKKCGGVCTCYTLPFWRGLEEHINAYIDGYTLRDLLDAKRNTPVCGGTGDADTNSAEKKDTEQ